MVDGTTNFLPVPVLDLDHWDANSSRGYVVITLRLQNQIYSPMMNKTGMRVDVAYGQSKIRSSKHISSNMWSRSPPHEGQSSHGLAYFASILASARAIPAREHLRWTSS